MSRCSVGASIPFCRSNQTEFPMTIDPSSGERRPASMRRKEVFPDPEAPQTPRRYFWPRVMEHRISSLGDPGLLSRRSTSSDFDGITGCSLSAYQVQRGESQKGKEKKITDGFPGAFVIHREKIVIGFKGQGSCRSGDISSHHHDDPKFSDCVGESQYPACPETRKGKGNDNPEKGSRPAGTKQPGHFNGTLGDLPKSLGHWLDGKRKAVEEGCDKEAFEGERKRVAQDLCKKNPQTDCPG